MKTCAQSHEEADGNEQADSDRPADCVPDLDNDGATSPGNDQASLRARASNGDTLALFLLKEHLADEGPFVSQCEDLGQRAASDLIQLASGSDLLLAEELKQQMTKLKEELCEESSGVLERQLGDRIVICWLHATYLERLSISLKDAPIAQQDGVRRRLDSAHNRHRSAIRELANLRRHLKPKVTGSASFLPGSIAERLGRQRGKVTVN